MSIPGVSCTEGHTAEWPQPSRRDPLWLDQPRRSHTPAHIARSRTISSRDRVRRPLGAQPHAGRRKPAAPDPDSWDPLWLGCFKGGKTYF
jgi:hypothetical protein